MSPPQWAMPKQSEKRGRQGRGRGGGMRLDDLYERIERARGLPPEEAVRICKGIVNDSILDAGMAPEDDMGVRSVSYGIRPDAPGTPPGAGPGQRRRRRDRPGGAAGSSRR